MVITPLFDFTLVPEITLEVEQLLRTVEQTTNKKNGKNIFGHVPLIKLHNERETAAEGWDTHDSQFI